MKEFNIILCGVGGQGVLTLAAIIARAALNHGFEVRAAELHGLSQRFGSIETHLRFGKGIRSPLVRQASAHLVLALEPSEALRACRYANPETSFLLDKKPIISNTLYQLKQLYPPLDEILKRIKRFSEKIYLTDATQKAKAMASPVMANVYLLGKACQLGLLPLEKSWLKEAIKEVVPERHLKENLLIFEAGCETED